MNRTELETNLEALLSAHFRFVRADIRAAEAAEGGRMSAVKDAAADEHEDAFRTARAGFLDAVGRSLYVLPPAGVVTPAEAIRAAQAEPLPATWPGSDPLDRDPEKPVDAAFPRVEVARKTEPFPRVTVTPPPESLAGELARHVRNNLARLAGEATLPATLIGPAAGTLDMAERLVEAVALLEEQHEHMGERLQAANMLGHRRALALSLRCVELNQSEQARAELAALLDQHRQDTAHQTPIIVPNIPLVPLYSIDELGRAIAERITEALAAEPLMRLLDAAREWVACPPDGDLLDELGGAIVDAVEACAGIKTARPAASPERGPATE